jgi:hypothetical protein
LPNKYQRMSGNFKSIMFSGLGFGLLRLSKEIELYGDAQPLIEGGVSTGRLFYHSMALLVVVAALGCFMYALRLIFGSKPKDPPEPKLPPIEESPVSGGESFDPDAIIKRYIESKKTSDIGVRPASGFGRKGL